MRIHRDILITLRKRKRKENPFSLEIWGLFRADPWKKTEAKKSHDTVPLRAMSLEYFSVKFLIFIGSIRHLGLTYDWARAHWPLSCLTGWLPAIRRKNVKIILEGQLTCYPQARTSVKPVLERVWPMAKNQDDMLSFPPRFFGFSFYTLKCCNLAMNYFLRRTCQMQWSL